MDALLEPASELWQRLIGGVFDILGLGPRNVSLGFNHRDAVGRSVEHVDERRTTLFPEDRRFGGVLLVLGFIFQNADTRSRLPLLPHFLELCRPCGDIVRNDSEVRRVGRVAFEVRRVGRLALIQRRAIDVRHLGEHTEVALRIPSRLEVVSIVESSVPQQRQQFDSPAMWRPTFTILAENGCGRKVPV